MADREPQMKEEAKGHLQDGDESVVDAGQVDLEMPDDEKFE